MSPLDSLPDSVLVSIRLIRKISIRQQSSTVDAYIFNSTTTRTNIPKTTASRNNSSTRTRITIQNTVLLSSGGVHVADPLSSFEENFPF